jgi:hypothetical protein
VSSASLFWACSLLREFLLFGRDFRNIIYYCCCQGFYKGDRSILSQSPESWVPALKSCLHIQGNYQLTASSQCMADLLLVIHFILVSINPRGNPARLISEILGAFLAEGTFAYEEVIFDLATDELVCDYTKAMTALVRTLEG